jgi:cell division protein FtsQ
MQKRRKYRRNRVRWKIVFFALLFLPLSFLGFRYYPTVRTVFVQKTVEQSFILEQVVINGIDNINKDSLYSSLPIKINMPLMDIDISSIEAVVYKNPWVDTVGIYVKYPNSINIEIKEKTPVAITVDGDDFAIVDKNGDVLTKEMLARHESLPMIISEKDRISEIVDYMLTQPYFYDQWKKAEFVGGRRWNVFIKEDVKIMLPENGVNDALEKLNELRLQGNLLKYKIKSIDLRFSDKAIIK